ncbi:MAG: hypothetical protein LBG71_03080, partial [Clostridiales Family XIII bacterium]|nr:hypothetical protein [Clostridiales Family XIII bacterium]
MEAARRAEMRERVDALLQRGAFFDAAVFAFGHCDATEETIDYLIEKGVAVRGILDNNKAKHGLAYRGVPISPPAVAAECGDAGIVLIATRFFEPMAAQLREMGYGGEIVRAADYNSFAEYSLSDETLGRMTARVERGAATLGRMRRRYPSHYLIVCPSNALGDVYWAMAFLPAYREKEKIGDFAIVVVGGGCRQVAEMFGAKDIVVLDGAEMDELVQALIFTREGNCLIAHHDRPYTDNIIRWLDRRFLSFIDYYRRAVYGLPQDAPPAAPVRVEPWPNADGIPEGKSVVIAPYAKSVARPETGFWEMLAREYAREGLTPCTVVNGGETPIDGTVP